MLNEVSREHRDLLPNVSQGEIVATPEALIEKLRTSLLCPNLPNKAETAMLKAVYGLNEHARDLREPSPPNIGRSLTDMLLTTAHIRFNGPVALLRVSENRMGGEITAGTVLQGGVLVRQDFSKQEIEVVDFQGELCRRQGEQPASLRVGNLPARSLDITPEARRFIVFNPQDPGKYDFIPRSSDPLEATLEQVARQRTSGSTFETFPGCELPDVMNCDVLRIGEGKGRVYIFAPRSTAVLYGHTRTEVCGPSTSLYREPLLGQGLQQVEFGTPTARNLQNDSKQVLEGDGPLNLFQVQGAPNMTLSLRTRPNLGAALIVAGEGITSQDSGVRNLCELLGRQAGCASSEIRELPKTPPLPMNFPKIEGRVELPPRVVIFFNPTDLKDLCQIVSGVRTAITTFVENNPQ